MHCKRRHCTTESDVKCLECDEDNSIFLRHNDDKECKRKYMYLVDVYRA